MFRGVVLLYVSPGVLPCLVGYMTRDLCQASSHLPDIGVCIDLKNNYYSTLQSPAPDVATLETYIRVANPGAIWRVTLGPVHSLGLPRDFRQSNQAC